MTVQGPVKKPQPDGMSHRGGGDCGTSPPQGLDRAVQGRAPQARGALVPRGPARVCAAEPMRCAHRHAPRAAPCRPPPPCALHAALSAQELRHAKLLGQAQKGEQDVSTLLQERVQLAETELKRVHATSSEQEGQLQAQVCGAWGSAPGGRCVTRWARGTKWVWLSWDLFDGGRGRGMLKPFSH